MSEDKKVVDYASDIEKHGSHLGKFLLECISPAHFVSAADAALILPDFDDPNIDKDEAVAGVLGIPVVLLQLFSSLKFFAEDDSPYPEVRSAVANTDDPDIPCNTIRAWVLGLLFGILLPV
jgi:hypothetical protein